MRATRVSTRLLVDPQMLRPMVAPMPRSLPTAPREVRLIRWALGLLVALAFPVSAVAVFRFGVNRHAAADMLSCTYGFGLSLLFATSFLPFPSLRAWTCSERVASGALLFLGVSYATHLSWELGWLVLFQKIRVSADAMWAYPWWAYIDGGDARYLHGNPEVVGMEILSVANGCVGTLAMRTHLASRGSSRVAILAILAMMGTAVVHFYSASLYYLSEIVGGMPNVDTTRFVNLYIKFGLANLPWVVMPWVVLAWGVQALEATLGRRAEGAPPSTDKPERRSSAVRSDE